MRERVVGVVEARMGSLRLPGKSLRLLAGRPMVERVVDRVRQSRKLDQVVVATSTSSRDDVLADTLRKLDVPVFRGSEEDVLARIVGAARAHEATVHVQCWGDAPFVDPDEIDRTVAALLSERADVAGNGLGRPRRLPYGLDVVAVRVEALVRAEAETRGLPYHREHGTTYLSENGDRFRIEALDVPDDLAFPALNLTVGTEGDLTFVSSVYELLAGEDLAAPTRFRARDVLRVLRSKPEWLSHPNATALRGTSSLG